MEKYSELKRIANEIANEIESLKKAKFRETTGEIADCIIEMVDELNQECLSKKPPNVSEEEYINFFRRKLPYSYAVVRFYPHYAWTGEEQEIWVGYELYGLGTLDYGLLDELKLGDYATLIEESINRKLASQATKIIPGLCNEIRYETPSGKYWIITNQFLKFLRRRTKR
jgi:hypothetical protein